MAVRVLNETTGGFEVAWREFDRNDTIVTKTKEFSSKKAMDRFIDRIKEKDNFYEIYGTRYPEEDTVSESAVRTVKRLRSKKLEGRVIPYIEDEDSGSRSNPKAGPWEIVPVPIGKVYNSREEAMRDPEVANSDKEVLLAEEGEELFDELLADVESMNNAYQESLRKNTRSYKK